VSRRRKLTGVFDRMVQFHSLRAAARRAAKGLTRRHQPAWFLAELEQNVLELQRSLVSDSWRPGRMRTFRIRDPKPRTIAVAPFVDRVVHHALCQALDPMFERFADPDSYACRVGQGQHRAIARVQTLSRRYAWHGRLDIQHFFETVRHDVLVELLERQVADKRALAIVGRLLEAGVGPPGVGLPIGNLTSQHFGNYILGYMDHHAREVARVGAWVRYMDDVVFFAADRETVWRAFDSLDFYVRTRLRLRLKDSATRVAPVEVGIGFLGMRIWPHTVRLDAARSRRAAARWRGLRRAVARGALPAAGAAHRAQALVAWTSAADTLRWRRALFSGRRGGRR
jgi:hypothetical protein